MNPRARLARHLRRGLREGIVKLWEVADRETRAAVARFSASRRAVAPEEFDTDGAMAVGLGYRPTGYRGRMVVFWTDPSAVASDGHDLGWAAGYQFFGTFGSLGSDDDPLFSEIVLTQLGHSYSFGSSIGRGWVFCSGGGFWGKGHISDVSRALVEFDPHHGELATKSVSIDGLL